MAQKLIYINKNLNGEGGALEWLLTLSSDIPYTSSSNIYFHSLVFTQDNYLVTHGNIYNGHDTIVDALAIETLGLLLSSGKINNQSLTVYATTTTALPASIFAPTTGGTKGQFLISDGSTNAPLWANLKDILKNTTYSITTNDPSTTNCVLKYTSNGLTWSPDNNTTYKLTLNGTNKGGGSTDLGTFYAPAAAGNLYQILLSNGSGAPSWVTLTSNLTNTANEDHTIPTSYAVKTYINDAVNGAVTQAMVYKGTVASHTNLPTGANVTNGDVYMFTGSGTYGSGAGAKDYKAGDTAIATVSGNTVTWEIVPSGNEQETFITVTSSEDLTSATYNQATGNVKLGTSVLKNYLVSSGTNDIANNITSTDLVSAKLVKDYVIGLGYSTTTGTVTNIATGTGLTGGPITNTGTIKANLKSETSLGSISDSNKIYAVGVGDTNGYLAVKVPWTDTTYSFAVGGSSATTNATTAVNDTVYVRRQPTGGSWGNIVSFTKGDGIGISAVNGQITITNTSRNVTTSMLVGLSNSTANAESTNGNTYIRLKEGSSYTNFNIVGAGAASVASDANGKITITGTNTWRPVYAYNLQNQALGSSSPAIAGTTGTAALAFGLEFAYTEGDATINSNSVSEIHLAWAEVAADGTISYAI